MNRNLKTHPILILILSICLTACVATTDRHFKLSQEHMKRGDYSAAFSHVAKSLESDIGNKKAQESLPHIASTALKYHESRAQASGQQRAWAQAVSSYREIETMNQRIDTIQKNIHGLMATDTKLSEEDKLRVQRVLDITLLNITEPYKNAKTEAAAVYYERAMGFVESKSYRSASHAFKEVNSYVPCYKDSCEKERRYRLLANEEDAREHYELAQYAADRKDYRTAAKELGHTINYVRNFRDARSLREKYNHLADRQDAEKHYQRAGVKVRHHQYREASAEFQRASSYIHNYKNSTSKALRYLQLANEQDAEHHYQEGHRYYNQGQFDDAAIAFVKSNGFISGYKDAVAMAAKANYASPPATHIIHDLILDEVLEHEIPDHWFGGNRWGVQISDRRITNIYIGNQGQYDRLQRRWNYEAIIHVSGTGTDMGSGTTFPVSGTASQWFYLYRDRNGEWEAEY